MGLAARFLFLCCVESQVRHTAEIEEYVLLTINEAEQYMATNGTPRDKARTLHI